MLESIQLGVSYGGVDALRDVNITVCSGEMVGLIGPNGAGKTTMIDTLSGFVRPSFGRVIFAGRDITGLATHRRSRLGLARTFQSVESFEPLTVEANVRAAADTAIDDGLFARLRRGSVIDEQIGSTLAQLDLTNVADAFPSELSYGRQKLVGLAMALVREPRVVLLDEPAAGLDAASIEVLGRQLRRVQQRGIGVLLVDHDMDVVFGLCQRVYVLDFGRLIAEGPPEVIRDDQRVRSAYLGEAVTIEPQPS
ncbi:MAG: ABC transporter ATP-binding protein [Ilumatobacteraceae bacterium]